MYYIAKVQLSDSQLDKLQSETKNATGVTLGLSSAMIGTNETNFPHDLLLTNGKVAGLRKTFRNS